jgi:hypothetical protein
VYTPPTPCQVEFALQAPAHHLAASVCAFAAAADYRETLRDKMKKFRLR